MYHMTHIHGFELIREQHIPELNTHGRLYRHLQTGAELLSLENNDENKVFGITFRTPPIDSTGVAHILEHAVLCGSRKYPLKEPFVELLKGSLKTFLNAFTYPDKTCYPVASQNTQDFYNLIDVYLDAVFYPRLTPHIFQQEGWHYELEQPDAPLIFKGVVFNEMKGAVASPERMLGEYSQRSLFPDITYGFSSGGDPQHIPDLTYEQLKSFHQTLYHPTNARIFFYGDDDPATRLQLIHDYLKDFSRLTIDSVVGLQPPFTAPKRITRSYVVDPDSTEDKKAMLTVNWVLTETNDPELLLGLNILEHILIATPASPLRKALIDSGLGEDLAASGLNDMLRQASFSVGLKGIVLSNASRIESLILTTLEHLVETGLDPHTIEAAVNTIEFRLRENNTGAFPRGLALMINALITWLHDGDPFATLAFAAPLQAIKARLAKSERYFEQLISQYLVHNTHRTTLILKPDPELGDQQARIEEARLQQARAAMTPNDIQAIIENTQQLKRLQETPDSAEALATIPSLHLSDLDRHNKCIPLTAHTLADTPVLYHDLFTNGIIYLDLGLNLHILPQELLPYVPLFGQALLEMGTEREDFVQLSQRIGRLTGGIHPRLLISATHGTSASTAWLFLRGKATPAHAQDLLAILQDTLLSVQLDHQERFRQIVLETRAGAEARVIPSGHVIVDRRLRSYCTEADWASEQMSGLSQIFFLRKLSEAVDRDWPTVLATLEHLRQLLINRNTMLCNVTVDPSTWQTFAPQLESYLRGFPSSLPVWMQWNAHLPIEAEGLTIPAQVNYVGKGVNLYQSGYRYHGSATVITRYLRTSWLWEKVRVQGGAYGGFCSFDRLSGVLSFLSYRDPNLLDTLKVYDQSSDFLRRVELSDTELTRSIIGAISDLDAYQLPDAKGFTSMVHYLIGDTQAVRQQMREEILGTTLADFRSFADVLESVRAEGHVVVMGSPTTIAAANATRPGWLRILQVL